MPAIGGAELVCGLIFGSIGFVAFMYGKRQHVWKPIVLGLALMGYPYFISGTAALYAIGVVLTSALYLLRD